MAYQTKQKTLILDFLKSNSNRHWTIDEMHQELTQNNIEVSQATLYRNLDSLTLDGKVRRYITNVNGKACFQYVDRDDCVNHFHMICTNCNKLIHLDCKEVSHLIGHIEDSHHFKIDLSKTVYYGLCEECQCQ